MEDIYTRLYEKLLYGSQIYSLCNYSLNCNGGSKEEFWSYCDDSIFFYLKLKNFDDENVKKGSFFVLIDYLTYIPYGDSGYLAFDNLLKKESRFKGVSEYRYNKVMEILKDDSLEIPSYCLNEIKTYFDDYLKESYDLNNAKDVAGFLCRLYHNCEASYSSLNRNKITDLAFSIVDFIADDDKEVINIKDVLNKLPECKSLTSKEINFIKSSVNFNSSNR